MALKVVEVDGIWKPLVDTATNKIVTDEINPCCCEEAPNNCACNCICEGHWIFYELEDENNANRNQQNLYYRGDNPFSVPHEPWTVVFHSGECRTHDPDKAKNGVAWSIKTPNDDPLSYDAGLDINTLLNEQRYQFSLRARDSNGFSQGGVTVTVGFPEGPQEDEECVAYAMRFRPCPDDNGAPGYTPGITPQISLTVINFDGEKKTTTKCWGDDIPEEVVQDAGWIPLPDEQLIVGTSHDSGVWPSGNYWVRCMDDFAYFRGWLSDTELDRVLNQGALAFIPDDPEGGNELREQWCPQGALTDDQIGSQAGTILEAVPLITP